MFLVWSDVSSDCVLPFVGQQRPSVMFSISSDQLHWFGHKVGYYRACKTEEFLPEFQEQLVRLMKNWNMTGFVIFTCLMFSSYSFGANLIFIIWFSLVFHCLRVGFCTLYRWQIDVSWFDQRFGALLTVPIAVCQIMRLSSLMMTPSNGKNPRTNASDAELWCFLWSAPD